MKKCPALRPLIICPILLTDISLGTRPFGGWHPRLTPKFRSRAYGLVMRSIRSAATVIPSRTSFYMATISETGWPYLQHRGGVPGFLRVIGDTRLAYADYRGNRQYISTGNLRTNPRIAIIAVDYPARKRLKLWGTVEISEDARVIDLLSMPGAPQAERAIVIRVAAYDWNCPQHIPVRRTDAEHDGEIAHLQARIDALEARLTEAGISPT